MSKTIFIFCLSFFLVRCEAFLNLQTIEEFLHNYMPFSQQDSIIKKTADSKELKDVCDENQILLQLARLYVTSPERIILLLSSKTLSRTCQDVSQVLENINVTISGSIPLPQSNLYLKLYNGLDHFNSYVCNNNPNTKGNHLNNYHECLAELREDLLDCEGPPDWFEKSQEAVVCQYYNEIINCNYIKAGMLCGLKPALMLRTFSDEIMKKIVTFKCKISRSLPHIDDPMPALGYQLKYKLNLILSTYFILRLYVKSTILIHSP